MMKFLFPIAIVLIPLLAVCQDKDTLRVVDTAGTIVPTHPLPTDTALSRKDTVAKKKYNPRTAAIRSAILP